MHSCYALFFPKFYFILLYVDPSKQSDRYPITNLSKRRQPIDISLPYYLANFIVVLIQSQIYRNIDNQSLLYIWLTSSWPLSNHNILSKHWHPIDVSLLYIWLTSSWPLSNHSSIETLTSNRYIVIFSLTLSWFLSNLQIYRNIEIQSIYRYFIFD